MEENVNNVQNENGGNEAANPIETDNLSSKTEQAAADVNEKVNEDEAIAEEQNDKKEEQPPKKEQISQENSDQILKAFIQEEKLIQQQLQQQKVNDTKRVLDKNW